MRLPICLAAVGLAIAWVALPHPTTPTATRGAAAFSFRAALRNRDAVILMIAYGATIWGAVALRQWIVLFLAFCAGDPTQSDWSMLAVASLITSCSAICLPKPSSIAAISNSACTATSSKANSPSS